MRQRNTDDEKKAIKQYRIPANWKAKPAKLWHKDRDARWTVKFSKAKPREADRGRGDQEIVRGARYQA
jgi:IS5 family transposase